MLRGPHREPVIRPNCGLVISVTGSPRPPRGSHAKHAMSGFYRQRKDLDDQMTNQRAPRAVQLWRLHPFKNSALIEQLGFQRRNINFLDGLFLVNRHLRGDAGGMAEHHVLRLHPQR